MAKFIIFRRDRFEPIEEYQEFYETENLEEGLAMFHLFERSYDEFEFEYRIIE